MTVARRKIIHLDSTPYYHCMARCVRRAFLCGEDHFSGQNFDHRKQWIVDKIKELVDVFAIHCSAYSVMSNHYHVVLRVDQENAKAWSQREVIDRWYQLFKGNMLVDRLIAGEAISKAETIAIDESVQEWRKRLMDISWFMRCLNESIARAANEEDKCRGRFWEGRFKSQALLDETALLTCMMYVDLNPIRAGVNKTLETSDYTSIQERIRSVAKGIRITKAKNKKTVKDSELTSTLLPFLGNEHQAKPQSGIPFPLKDYLELIDWTGRAVRDDKKGAIPNHIAPIMKRLNLNEKEWLNNVQHFEQRFIKAAGSIDAVRQFSATLESAWLQGLSYCKSLYRQPTTA